MMNQATLNETVTLAVRYNVKLDVVRCVTTAATATLPKWVCGVASTMLVEVNATPVTVTELSGALDVPAMVAKPLREKAATPLTCSALPLAASASNAPPVLLLVTTKVGTVSVAAVMYV